MASRWLVRSALVLAALPILGACVSSSDDDGPTRPASTYSFADAATPDDARYADTMTQVSCGFSRQAPNEGQYFADARALTQSGATDEAVVVVRFPDTDQTVPTAGELMVPSAVAVEITLPIPYGTMTASAGTVTVNEDANWRTLDIAVEASTASEGGTFTAKLVCPL